MRKTKHNKYLLNKNKPAKPTTVIKRDYLLSESDRITFCYENIPKTRKIVKVVNVSYEFNIDGQWITLIRFDSDHGYLHRHIRVSLQNKATIVDQNNLVIRGTAKHWLSWAIRHLTREYYLYREKFLKRSNLESK